MVSMALSNFGYSFREVGHHFRRSWSTVLGAIVTIFLSLFIIGLFLLGSALIDNMVGTVEDRVTIQAFLSDNASQSDVDALRLKIQGWDNVESVTYKSKEEALEEYRNTMSNRNASDAVAALDGENPIPASLVIKLDDPQLVEETANRLIGDADFGSVSDGTAASSVQYGRDTVEKLFSFANYLRLAAVVLVGLLTFVAFVFINNTIRLAITARRREISIMRLVGASNSFIRGPFLLEGALEALIGAVLAIVALHFGMNELISQLSGSLQFLSFDIPARTTLMTFAALPGIGVVIGLFGSAIAMRRYLKA